MTGFSSSPVPLNLFDSAESGITIHWL